LDPLVRDAILELFKTGDPANRTIFDSAVRLLVRSHRNTMELEQLAQSRVRSLQSGAAFMTWMVVLLQIDAEAALDILEAKLSVEQDPGEIVFRLCALLGGRRLNELPAL